MIWWHKYDLGDGPFLVTFGGPWSRGPNLSFDPSQVERLGAAGAGRAAAWFQEHLREFDRYHELLVNIANGQILMEDEHLWEVIASPVTPEDLREEAERELQARRNRPAPKPPVPPLPGAIYVLRAEDGSGLYKIGRSTRPRSRVGQIGIQLPFETAVAVQIASQDTRALEQSLHRRFAAVRVRGEWFRLDDTHLQELAQMAEAAP